MWKLRFKGARPLNRVTIHQMFKFLKKCGQDHIQDNNETVVGIVLKSHNMKLKRQKKS